MMTLKPIALLGIAASALLLAGCASPANSSTGAAGYPTKTIHLVIPYGAGGGTDLSGRLMASGLEDKLGAKVVIENDASASGQNAVQKVADANPDGYTLGFVSLPATNMMYLDSERGAKFTRESFTPVAVHDTDTVAIAVSSTSKYKTLGDVVAAAKSSPGSITAGSSGVLAVGHLGVLALQKAAGIKITWSTFDDSGQLRTSVLGNNVTLEVGPVSELAPAAASGDLKILALLGDQRMGGSLANVPTAKELGYDGVSVSANRVLVAPAKTPQKIVDALAAAIKSAQQGTAYKAQAASRSLNLNFQDAAAATALWTQFDSTFGPIAKEYRASEK
ncbi:MAG: putative Bug family protein precursor [Glaciihabitans sp.]|nr:putative Bug family protein precursor [Glaciihabitans sp.]